MREFRYARFDGLQLLPSSCDIPIAALPHSCDCGSSAVCVFLWLTKKIVSLMKDLKVVTPYLLLLTTTLLVASCSDDSNPQAPPENNPVGEFMNCRIVKMERENFDDRIYIYNGDGKLTFHDASNASYEYSYNGSITTIKYYYSEELQRTETVTNNSAGFATHIEAVYENGITPTKLTDFEYDDKNQLIKSTVKNEGETDEDHTVYQWLDGNMIAETDLDDDDLTTYVYSSDLTQPAEWFNQINLERGYVTIRNKNRLTKITVPSGTTYTHSYNENDDGRIESLTIKPSDSNPYTKKFTYECD